jgi:hypothetical protein
MPSRPRAGAEAAAWPTCANKTHKPWNYLASIYLASTAKRALSNRNRSLSKAVSIKYEDQNGSLCHPSGPPLPLPPPAFVSASAAVAAAPASAPAAAVAAPAPPAHAAHAAAAGRGLTWPHLAQLQVGRQAPPAPAPTAVLAPTASPAPPRPVTAPRLVAWAWPGRGAGPAPRRRQAGQRAGEPRLDGAQPEHAEVHAHLRGGIVKSSKVQYIIV